MAITRALLSLLRGTSPQLVFVSSVAAVLPVPLYAVYGATKAALESFAANLRMEPGARVRIQLVVPEATHRLASAILGAVPQRRHTLIPGAANRMFTLLGVSARGLTNILMRRALFDQLQR